MEQAHANEIAVDGCSSCPYVTWLYPLKNAGVSAAQVEEEDIRPALQMDSRPLSISAVPCASVLSETASPFISFAKNAAPVNPALKTRRPVAGLNILVSHG